MTMPIDIKHILALSADECNGIEFEKAMFQVWTSYGYSLESSNIAGWLLSVAQPIHYIIAAIAAGESDG